MDKILRVYRFYSTDKPYNEIDLRFSIPPGFWPSFTPYDKAKKDVSKRDLRGRVTWNSDRDPEQTFHIIPEPYRRPDKPDGISEEEWAERITFGIGDFRIIIAGGGDDPLKKIPGTDIEFSQKAQAIVAKAENTTPNIFNYETMPPPTQQVRANQNVWLDNVEKFLGCRLEGLRTGFSRDVLT